MLSLIPRSVAFDESGKAIVAGVASNHYPNRRVIHLPSEHYDFIDFDVRGKTEEEILQEVAAIMERSK